MRLGLGRGRVRVRVLRLGFGYIYIHRGVKQLIQLSQGFRFRA